MHERIAMIIDFNLTYRALVAMEYLHTIRDLTSADITNKY